MWSHLEAALNQQAGRSLELPAGANDEDLDSFEQAVGALPNGFRELYRTHDGDGGLGAVEWSVLPLSEVLARWRSLCSLFPSSAWWNHSWIPFAESSAGDYICVDLRTGKVIRYWHDSSQRDELAADLHAFFEDFARALERGEYYYDPDEDVVFRAGS